MPASPLVEGLAGKGTFTRNLVAVGRWQGPQGVGEMSGNLSMKPTLDFEMHQGAYRKVTVTVADDDGMPIDLTGFRIAWAVSSAGVEKSTVTGSVKISDQATDKGNCYFELKTLDTAEVPPGRYYHQLLVEDAAKNADIVMEGWLTLQYNIMEI